MAGNGPGDGSEAWPGRTPPEHLSDAGLDWLAEASPDPDTCRRQWRRGGSGLTMLPAGRRWDVLLVPGALGLPALAVLALTPRGLGPVLADFGDENLAFLVPPGTAARWLGTGVRVAGAGSWILLPPPSRRAGGCLRWLVAPDGSGRLTDPVLLELALHDAAAGLGDPCAR
ncbi:bifunctional DNA primase/polymerase [Kitasatospora sp. NPDC057015]|uniref:bifunctional DNA primase/polymerase n=1 Tax=Kitasatospora sp. NPDC057015 TaxID=3346001 RepID=UPI00364367D3